MQSLLTNEQNFFEDSPCRGQLFLADSSKTSAGIVQLMQNLYPHIIWCSNSFGQLLNSAQSADHFSRMTYVQFAFQIVVPNGQLRMQKRCIFMRSRFIATRSLYLQLAVKVVIYLVIRAIPNVHRIRCMIKASCPFFHTSGRVFHSISCLHYLRKHYKTESRSEMHHI